MNKIILAAALMTAAFANAQTVVIPPAGFQAEKMNACRKFGEAAIDTYSIYKASPKMLPKLRGAHPVDDRVIDAIVAGRVHDQQAAYQLGVAYCYDYIDEQARK